MKKIKITIIGGGFGGIYTLKGLHNLFHGHKEFKVEVTLINDKNYFLFTPLLHEVATGSINPENIIEPIRKILGCCLENLYIGTARQINLENKTLKVNDTELICDYLVLAPGAETTYYGIPGAAENTFTLKSLEDAVSLKNRVITKVEQASAIKDREIRKSMLRFVVVGGGPTGVEYAAELHEFTSRTFARYYDKELIEDISVVLVQKMPELIPQFHPKLRAKSLEVLKKKGIQVLLNTSVTNVTANSIELDNKDILSTETVVWVAGIQPAHLDFATPSALLPNGKLSVNQFMQLDGHPEVFAIGDVASMKDQNGVPLPALAQVATKQAESLARNIKRLVEGQELKAFEFQSRGTLVSLGRWMAIGEVYKFVLSGRITWWMWRTVYLSKLISWQKKLSVAVDWTINLFSPRDISKL